MESLLLVAGLSLTAVHLYAAESSGVQPGFPTHFSPDGQWVVFTSERAGYSVEEISLPFQF